MTTLTAMTALRPARHPMLFLALALALAALTGPLGAIGAARAQVPSQPPDEAPGEELGRLFHTPRQRADLDQQRRNGPDNIDRNRPLTLDGQVRRSSGRRTLWINGQPAEDGNLPTLPPGLRPGETAHPDGSRSDALNGGAIIISPGRAGR